MGYILNRSPVSSLSFLHSKHTLQFRHRDKLNFSIKSLKIPYRHLVTYSTTNNSKMPFFPEVYFSSPETNFLDLLAALDQPQQKSCAVRYVKPQPTFTPRFDVTETTQAYELFGELPGLEQKDLSIEFSDAQTLVIKGQTSRKTSEPSFTQTEPEAAVEGNEVEMSDTASQKSRNATVEDEYDEADTPLVKAAVDSHAEEKKEEQPAEKKGEERKFWVKERKVGSFARSFAFSQRIEQDAVAANLKNGVLHVVVPKSGRGKKVVVSVQ